MYNIHSTSIYHDHEVANIIEYYRGDVGFLRDVPGQNGSLKRCFAAEKAPEMIS